MDNDTIKYLGLCPICQKGHIMKGSLGYSCNYFKNMNDKCTFNIYHSYWGKEITEEIARQLITTGKTDIFHDFHNKKGVPFSAYLTIENGIVIPSFVNEVLETPCPVCGREIEILLNGYACKGYSQKDKDNNRVCNLYIPKTIAQREIPLEAAEILARGKKTPFMTGFKSREGNDFSSRLVLTENLDISFDNTLCKCPKCGGNLYINKKAYNCSNYRNEAIKCDFVIWREMSGRSITPEEAIELCEKKETPVLTGFHDKNGQPMERKLVLNDDFKIKLI